MAIDSTYCLLIFILSQRMLEICSNKFLTFLFCFALPWLFSCMWWIYYLFVILRVFSLSRNFLFYCDVLLLSENVCFENGRSDIVFAVPGLVGPKSMQCCFSVR